MRLIDTLGERVSLERTFASYSYDANQIVRREFILLNQKHLSDIFAPFLRRFSHPLALLVNFPRLSL